MRDYLIAGTPLEAVLTAVNIDFPGYEIEIDKNLRLFKTHTRNVMSGKKTHTVRCRPGKLRIPAKERLPWIETTPRKPYEGPTVGLLFIPRIHITTVGTLRDNEATKLGYEDREDMILDMCDTYNDGEMLDDREAISVYDISVATYRPRK